MAKVEFFFDLSSPWTCLTFYNIQPIIAETKSEVVWRPFLVGGVFNAVNQGVYAGRAIPNNPKNRHALKWLKDWARLSGVPMNFPSQHHPLKSVRLMRLCCVIQDDQAALFCFASHAFTAYFRDKRNLDDPAVLSQIASAIGLDGQRLLEQSGEEDIKHLLRSNTQEAIERGAFGSPTIFVNETQIFFGNDQLPIVRQAILGKIN